LGKEVKETIEGFDLQELEILQPIERRLRSVLLRSLPDSEWENAFDNEILPTIDALSKDKSAEKIFKKVEETIEHNLGRFVFNHYKNREEGKILKILRAGEITFLLIKENTENIDLSVKMFPFFKASEVACRLHTHGRYEKLREDSTLNNIIDWMGDDPGNILKAKGIDEDKVALAKDLNNLQELRNERVHRGIEENEKKVQQSRILSYTCLKKIPEILEI